MNYLVTNTLTQVIDANEDYALIQARAQELASTYPGQRFCIYQLVSNTVAEVSLPKTLQVAQPLDAPVLSKNPTPIV